MEQKWKGKPNERSFEFKFRICKSENSNFGVLFHHYDVIYVRNANFKALGVQQNIIKGVCDAGLTG